MNMRSWGMEKIGDFYRDGYGMEKDFDLNYTFCKDNMSLMATI